MEITAEVAKELLWLEKGEDEEGFLCIKSGKWVNDGKYDHRTMILQHQESGKFYFLDDSRSRSDSEFTDYYYDSDDWKGMVSLTEAEPYQKTVTRYREVGSAS